jgi:hypothetical protein
VRDYSSASALTEALTEVHIRRICPCVSGLSEDAEVGDPVGVSFAVMNSKGSVVFSIDSIVALFGNGATKPLPNDFFILSSNGSTGGMFVNSVVDQYIGSYIKVTIRATTSFNQTAVSYITVKFSPDFISSKCSHNLRNI